MPFIMKGCWRPFCMEWCLPMSPPFLQTQCPAFTSNSAADNLLWLLLLYVTGLLFQYSSPLILLLWPPDPVIVPRKPSARPARETSREEKQVRELEKLAFLLLLQIQPLSLTLSSLADYLLWPSLNFAPIPREQIRTWYDALLFSLLWDPDYPLNHSHF